MAQHEVPFQHFAVKNDNTTKILARAVAPYESRTEDL